MPSSALQSCSCCHGGEASLCATWQQYGSDISELQGRVAAMTTVFAEHEGESVSQRPLLLLPTDFTHKCSSRETANDWLIVSTLLIYGRITFSELWVTTGNYSENSRNGRMGNFLQKVGNISVLVSSDAITWLSSWLFSDLPPGHWRDTIRSFWQI